MTLKELRWIWIKGNNMRCGVPHTDKKIYSVVSHIDWKMPPLRQLQKLFFLILSPPYHIVSLLHTKAAAYRNHLWFFISIFDTLLLCEKWQEVTGKGSDKGTSVRESQAECEKARFAGWTGTSRLEIMPDEWCPPLRLWEAGSVAPY